MKELIEDYKRQVKNIESFLKGTENMTDNIMIHRTRARAECFRTFITELEAIEKETTK